MIKEFHIKVNVEEEDFCFSDLRETILDGSDNVGNHTISDVEEIRK